GAAHPDGGLLLTQNVADCERLLEIAAWGVEVDRQLTVADLLHELAETRRGAVVDLAFGCDPAVAARSAGVRRAFDESKGNRRGPIPARTRGRPRSRRRLGLHCWLGLIGRLRLGRRSDLDG